MEPSVYLETTFFSFYFDERLESSYRRRVTRDWWETQKVHYKLVTSYFVLAETKEPIYPNCEEVSAFAQGVPVLEVVPDIKGIVKAYIDNRLMPSNDMGDAAHLAIASFHSVEYLLTWNCKHLANANKFEHMQKINRRLGLLTPTLVTPEQLFMESSYE